MGHDVVAHSHTYVSEPNKIQTPTLLYKIFWKLRIPLDDMRVNLALRKNVKKGNAYNIFSVEPAYVESTVKTKNNAFVNYIVKKDSLVNRNNNNLPSNNTSIIEPLIATNNTSKVKEPAPHPYNPVVINYYNENEPELIAQVQPKKTEKSFVQKMQNSAWESVGKVPANVAEEESKSKSKRMNLLALIGNGLKKMGVKKSGAQKIHHEDEDYVEYNVNIAGITISKKELN
jgi:hypothetical protein